MRQLCICLHAEEFWLATLGRAAKERASICKELLPVYLSETKLVESEAFPMMGFTAMKNKDQGRQQGEPVCGLLASVQRDLLLVLNLMGQILLLTYMIRGELFL